MNASTFRERYPETFKARAACRAARKEYEETKQYHNAMFLAAIRRYLAIFDGQYGDPAKLSNTTIATRENAARWSLTFSNKSFKALGAGEVEVFRISTLTDERLKLLREWREKKPAWREAAEREGAPLGRDPGTYTPEEIAAEKESRVHRVKRHPRHRVNPPEGTTA